MCWIPNHLTPPWIHCDVLSSLKPRMKIISHNLSWPAFVVKIMTLTIFHQEQVFASLEVMWFFIIVVLWSLMLMTIGCKQDNTNHTCSFGWLFIGCLFWNILKIFWTKVLKCFWKILNFLSHYHVMVYIKKLLKIQTIYRLYRPIHWK
jgi:hypothetical protein